MVASWNFIVIVVNSFMDSNYIQNNHCAFSNSEREQARNLIKEMFNLRVPQKREESSHEYPTDIVANLLDTAINVTKYAFVS